MFFYLSSLTKYFSFFFLLALASLQANTFLFKAPKEVTLISKMAELSHPVTTDVAEAQSFFNQGLAYKYAFNEQAAYWSFQKAAKLDPKMAMAYWGMALALGPTLHSPITVERARVAYEQIQKAIKLSDRITDNEKEYIQALALRYSPDANADFSQLELAYKNGMQSLANTYLDDIDASALYIESLLICNPWRHWTQAGAPKGEILQVVNKLEELLKRSPNHIGANCYYVYATKDSIYPQRAIISAQRLQKLLPSCGHFFYLASQLSLKTGEFQKAVKSAEAAIVADKDFMHLFDDKNSYFVTAMSQNYACLIKAHTLLGNFKQALRTAQELQTFYVPYFETFPDLQHYAMAPQWVLMNFHKWKELLNLKSFPEKMQICNTLLSFSKAYATLVIKGSDASKSYLEAFLKSKQKIISQKNSVNSYFPLFFKIAYLQFLAKQADMQTKTPQTINYLKEAIELQDILTSNFTVQWYCSIRKNLGAVLLKNRQHLEAEELFRQELKLHSGNSYALFGLMTALRAQQKDTDAFWVKKRLEQIWPTTSAPIEIKNFF